MGWKGPDPYAGQQPEATLGKTPWRRLCVWIGTGFGIGLVAPCAPGTFGSLPGVALAVAFAAWLPCWWAQTLLCLALTLLAVPICTVAEECLKKKDAGRISADEWLLYPIAIFTTWLSYGILRLSGHKAVKTDMAAPFNREDLVNLMDAETVEPQQEEEDEIKIFQNALDFADLRVRDCMVSRVDVEAVDIDDTSIEELTQRFIETKFSRIFVWRESIDNIIGYVNSKSLFEKPAAISEVMKKVNCVAETLPLQNMLQTFIKQKSSVAVVIDEFGGTAGIISLEDVLEEIFGDIEDEHDVQRTVEKKIAEGEYIFSCRLDVEYLNEHYGLGIEESDEYDTLAGYIIRKYEGIPAAGETLLDGGLEIHILRSTRARVELARVKKM